MIRILQSPWIALALGVAIYCGTTIAVLQPGKLVEKYRVEPTYPEDQVREIQPSWAFKNPEVDQLITELRREREVARARAQELNELETRLAVERQEISTITQEVSRLQAQLDAEFIAIREGEQANLKRLARVYGAMSPEGAAKILLEFEDEQAVKIFALMKEQESAPILELMAKEGQPAARRVALISDQLRRLRAKPTASTPRTPRTP